jgi:hypothetical protein
MTITPGTILLAVALLLLVLLFLARPFLLRRLDETRPATREEVGARKDAYLQQIADLDFDHETGKVPDRIYEQERRQLLLRAALLLRQLDTLTNGHATGVKAARRGDEGVEAQIEQAILALRQQRAAARKRPAPATNGDSRAYCPHCGQPIHTGDNFCRSCGHSLQQQA